MMPLVLVGLMGVLTQMATARAELYQRVADMVVDTDDVDAETVAGLIVGAVGADRSCA